MSQDERLAACLSALKQAAHALAAHRDVIFENYEILGGPLKGQLSDDGRALVLNLDAALDAAQGAIAKAEAGQDEARARLIEAAPDCLNALKAIRSWLLFAKPLSDPESQFYNEAFFKANNLANAAIAKAEGSR